jgi:hypothetical protein
MLRLFLEDLYNKDHLNPTLLSHVEKELNRIIRSSEFQSQESFKVSEGTILKKLPSTKGTLIMGMPQNLHDVAHLGNEPSKILSWVLAQSSTFFPRMISQPSMPEGKPGGLTLGALPRKISLSSLEDHVRQLVRSVPGKIPLKKYAKFLIPIYVSSLLTRTLAKVEFQEKKRIPGFFGLNVSMDDDGDGDTKTERFWVDIPYIQDLSLLIKDIFLRFIQPIKFSTHSSANWIHLHSRSTQQGLGKAEFTFDPETGLNCGICVERDTDTFQLMLSVNHAQSPISSQAQRVVDQMVKELNSDLRNQQSLE